MMHCCYSQRVLVVQQKYVDGNEKTNFTYSGNAVIRTRFACFADVATYLSSHHIAVSVLCKGIVHSLSSDCFHDVLLRRKAWKWESSSPRIWLRSEQLQSEVVQGNYTISRTAFFVWWCEQISFDNKMLTLPFSRQTAQTWLWMCYFRRTKTQVSRIHTAMSWCVIWCTNQNLVQLNWKTHRLM